MHDGNDDLARLLGQGEGSAGPDDATRLQELPGMDSLRFMQLVSAIEARTGASLDLDVLTGLETVGDVRRLLA